MKRLTSIQLCVLRDVADPSRLHWAAAPGHGNTLRSLERLGLIEHTCTGWRVTPLGRQALK